MNARRRRKYLPLLLANIHKVMNILENLVKNAEILSNSFDKQIMEVKSLTISMILFIHHMSFLPMIFFRFRH